MNALEVQDQTKNSLWDDPYEGLPTTKGQSLVFGLPGNVYYMLVHLFTSQKMRLFAVDPIPQAIYLFDGLSEKTIIFIRIYFINP